MNIFGDYLQLLASLARIAPPGEARARKLDALDAVSHTATAFGTQMPDWFTS
ncbi:MAG: hypothetical protein ACRERX_23520 [Pseudomonas sp.]